ncbi:MAG: hypothetical protein U0228_14565 [Myxococcaceae bacterium]
MRRRLPIIVAVAVLVPLVGFFLRLGVSEEDGGYHRRFRDRVEVRRAAARLAEAELDAGLSLPTALVETDGKRRVCVGEACEEVGELRCLNRDCSQTEPVVEKPNPNEPFDTEVARRCAWLAGASRCADRLIAGCAPGLDPHHFVRLTGEYRDPQPELRCLDGNGLISSAADAGTHWFGITRDFDGGSVVCVGPERDPHCECAF